MKKYLRLIYASFFAISLFMIVSSCSENSTNPEYLSYAGTVRDVSGAPIKGATVEAFDTNMNRIE
ncbi:MAG: carboxypeptidase-like regulatory domain-containing protein, partial [Candidatus Kapaibacterium sp.]